MDHEDVWKKSIGFDLYKHINLNVDPTMRQRIGQCISENVISREESIGMSHLLFKDGKGHLHDSWRQGFYMDENIKYGVF